MSTKRARYTGPFPEVTIWWPPGETVPEKTYVVAQNHWLPDDAPAKLRDELLQSDDWSEVEQEPTTTTSKKGDS